MSVTHARRLGWSALVLLLLAAPLATIRPATAATDPDVVPGRYIVVYRDGIVAAAAVTDLYAGEPGVEVTHVYEHALNGFAGELSDARVRELRADPRVATVIPDRKMYPFAQTVTPGANRVDADLNPYAGIDGTDERVDADIAILDMGVGPHGDLNVVGGTDCTGQNTTQDNGGHGTHVAGIAAAKDNAFGIVGVAPGARIWSVKVLDAYDGNWSWVICGIDWLTAHADTIEVANMSLGEDLGPNNQVYDAPMHDAIKRAVNAGVTIVVAAGNGATDAANVIPATYPEVITVSAIADSDGKPGGLGPALSAGPDDHLADFSDYGADVDIAAPGVDTYSTAPGGGYSTMSGTSFATPHVTGAVALYIAQHGRVGPAAVRTALRTTADPGPIPGDPDSFPEGVLNVRRFGGGTIGLSAASGKPGDSVTASLGGFPAGGTITLAWDGTAAGSVTANGSGSAQATLTVPAIAKGTHALSATSGSVFAAIGFTTSPTLRQTSTSGPVGTTVTVALRGFGSRETIDVLWKNNGRVGTLATVTASSSGNVNATVRIPASIGGTHALTADGRSGSLVKTTFWVSASMARSPSSQQPGGTVKVGLRGFRSSEQVTIALQTSAGTTTLISTTVSTASGSRDATVTIPANAPPGGATLGATGSAGSSASASFTVLQPATSAGTTPTATPTIAPASPTVPAETTPEPTPTPTETSTSTPGPTQPEPTATSTATDAPTVEATIATEETVTGDAGTGG